MASDARSLGVEGRARDDDEEDVFFAAGVCGKVLFVIPSFGESSSSSAAFCLSLNSSMPSALA